MEPAETYTIDISQTLRKKFGEKTPKWVLRLARKILHEDFLNEYFREGYTCPFCDRGRLLVCNECHCAGGL